MIVTSEDRAARPPLLVVPTPPGRREYPVRVPYLHAEWLLGRATHAAESPPPTARTVDMPPAQLILGTGLMSGRMSPNRARRVIAAALDAGVTRIDTARAYGDGETEHLIGAVLRRRPHVEIVTKAGLGPLERRPVEAARWRAASPVLGLLPSRTAATALPGDEEADDDTGAHFDERTLRTSIDVSRRALRRERLDLVLLHEADVPRTDAAAAVMDALVDEGVVGAWGVGTRRAALRRLRAAGAPVGAQVQTTGGPLLPPPPAPESIPLSVHSVLGPGGSLLNAFLAWLPGTHHRTVWEEVVGPLTARRTAGAELLRAAVSDARVAAVLVSSRDAESIARTVAAVRAGEDDVRSALLAPVFAAFLERSER